MKHYFHFLERYYRKDYCGIPGNSVYRLNRDDSSFETSVAQDYGTIVRTFRHFYHIVPRGLYV